jgi:hypothetical protein
MQEEETVQNELQKLQLQEKRKLEKEAGEKAWREENKSLFATLEMDVNDVTHIDHRDYKNVELCKILKIQEQKCKDYFHWVKLMISCMEEKVLNDLKQDQTAVEEGKNYHRAIVQKEFWELRKKIVTEKQSPSKWKTEHDSFKRHMKWSKKIIKEIETDIEKNKLKNTLLTKGTEAVKTWFKNHKEIQDKELKTILQKEATDLVNKSVNEKLHWHIKELR